MAHEETRGRFEDAGQRDDVKREERSPPKPPGKAVAGKLSHPIYTFNSFQAALRKHRGNDPRSGQADPRAVPADAGAEPRRTCPVRTRGGRVVDCREVM